MRKPKDPAKEPPTPEQRKAEAIQKIGNDGVVIVRGDGTVEAVDLNVRKKPKPPKGSSKPPLKPKAGADLAYGYKVGEFQTGRRLERTYGWSQKEASELRKLAIYCWMMNIAKFTDEPERARAGYFVDVDDVDELRLSEAMEDQAERRWSDNKQIALEAGLALLSPQEQRAVWLRIGERLSVEEVAERMKVDEDTVYQYVWRAEKKWEKLRDGEYDRWKFLQDL